MSAHQSLVTASFCHHPTVGLVFVLFVLLSWGLPMRCAYHVQVSSGNGGSQGFDALISARELDRVSLGESKLLEARRSIFLVSADHAYVGTSQNLGPLLGGCFLLVSLKTGQDLFRNLRPVHAFCMTFCNVFLAWAAIVPRVFCWFAVFLPRQGFCSSILNVRRLQLHNTVFC